MSIMSFSNALPNPLPVLAHAVTGYSNHNSVDDTMARETLDQVMADALSKSGSNRSAAYISCLLFAMAF
ncbi:hypothetical protein V6Z12_D13G162800 [Gossypium hirsutum]